MVDATIKYPGGGTIEGLTASDFTLTEDDVEQTISVFQFHQADDLSSYLLGYYPRNQKPDGAFRKIKLAVKTASTAIVNYRMGYFGLKREDNAPAPSAGPYARPDPGIRPPVLIYKKEPEYSEEARQAKYQGVVTLDLEVTPSDAGLARPTNIKVVRSLGLGLDEKAIEAVKQWKFKPATKDGKPIAIRITTEVSFRLL